MKAFMTFVLVSSCMVIFAQKQVKQKLYTAKIVTHKATLSGALLNCSDTAIAVVDLKLAKLSIKPSDNGIQLIPVTNLIKIKVRRTGAIRRAALTLGIIGGLTGAIIGMANRPEEDLGVFEPFSAGNYAMSGAFVGFTIGGVVGLAAGSRSKNFLINHKQDAYQKHKEILMKYIYVPRY